MEDLERAVEEAVRACPELAAHRQAFIASIAGDAAGSFQALDPQRAGEWILAWACANEDDRALKLLEQRYLSRLPELLAGLKPSADEVDEIRQLVSQRLLVPASDGRMRIADFDGRAPLATWLRVVAVRLASNLRRDRQAVQAKERRYPTPAAAYIDPELDLIRRRFGAAFHNAFRDAFQTLSAEERTTFRLHYLDGLALEDIGSMLSVSRATIGRRLLEGRRRLIEATLAELGRGLSISEKELESLFNAVRSGLEISLGHLLRDAGI